MSIFHCIISSLIQAIAGVFIALKISNIKIKHNLPLTLKIYLSNFIYLVISGILIPKNFRFFFSLLLLTIIYYLFIDRNVKKSLVKTFFTVIILSISEILCSGILYFFINDMNDIANIWYLNILLATLIVVVSILISVILSKSIIRLISKIEKISVTYMYIILIIIYLAVAKNALYIKINPEVLINLIILIFSLLLFVLALMKEIKNNQLEEANKQMINHVTKYEKIITDQGKANHEFKNQLMVIRGYAQMNSPKLIEYLDSVIKDSKKTHSSYLISQLNKFPAGGIKGLLYYKLSTMDDENIKHELNVESGVKIRLDTLGTETYKNITKVLGVLFDNAIDACKKSKSKKIIIDVVKKTNSVTFSIYNTYKGKIDMDKIGTGFTTKGSGHGYGLRLVKDIVENSNIFEIENALEDEYYVTKLTIKTKNRQTKKKK